MRKIESWQTTDDKLFDNESDAWAHQTKIDLIIALERDEIMGTHAGSKAINGDVIDWIGDHANLIMQYIEATNPKR